jgi:hypothetical protein
MRIIDWLYRDPEGFKSELIYIPVAMDHAIETLMYMNKQEKDEVILKALDEYLVKNIYATKETGQRTQFKRMKQLRK